MDARRCNLVGGESDGLVIGAVETVSVSGLSDLQRAFKAADITLSRELTVGLRKAAEPVREEAEQLAGSRIRNILSPTAEVDWWRMRVGITTSSVYVAPFQRSRLSRRNPLLKRRNLAPLLLERAMEPALDHNRGRVVAAVDDVLATVGRKWESV